MQEKELITKMLQYIIRLLVEKKYKELERLTSSRRLTSLEIENAIADYGEVLIFPPDEAFNQIDVIEINGSNPKSWSIRFDLWTEVEGLSDLSLEATLKLNKEKSLDVEIDNLHML